MPGRAQQKVFCQGFTRAGLREGKKIPCRMKGYPLSGVSYSSASTMDFKTTINLIKLNTQMTQE